MDQHPQAPPPRTAPAPRDTRTARFSLRFPADGTSNPGCHRPSSRPEIPGPPDSTTQLLSPDSQHLHPARLWAKHSSRDKRLPGVTLPPPLSPRLSQLLQQQRNSTQNSPPLFYGSFRRLEPVGGSDATRARVLAARRKGRGRGRGLAAGPRRS